MSAFEEKRFGTGECLFWMIQCGGKNQQTEKLRMNHGFSERSGSGS